MYRFTASSHGICIAILLSMLCWSSIALASQPDPPKMLTKAQPTDASPLETEAVAPAGSQSIIGPAFLAPSQYVVIDIMPADGTAFSKGYGINNRAQIMGRTYNVDGTTQEVEDQRALYWDPGTGSTALSTLDGTSGGWGINDSGMACGFSTNSDGNQRAVRWNLETQALIDLGSLTNPNTLVSGDESYAYGGINNLDTVVGHSEIPNDAGDFIPYHGIIYDDTNGLRDLGTLNPDTVYMDGYSIAYDITETNTVVGLTHVPGWDFRPFVWTEQAGMSALPIDNARPTGEWYAVSINESGVIGGHAIDNDIYYPYYWPSQNDAPIALSMPAAYPSGEIYAMNENGQMVGAMFNASEEDRAFIVDTTNAVVVDLNDRINAARGWVLEAAIDINDLGQITGFGLADGDKRAFLLTPSADSDADNDIDGSDIALLIQEMGTAGCSGACVADYNDDDNVNDIDMVLMAMALGRPI